MTNREKAYKEDSMNLFLRLCKGLAYSNHKLLLQGRHRSRDCAWRKTSQRQSL